MNIADFFSRRANESPDFPVIEQGDVSTSYGELRDLAERMARRLLILGYQPGDIIGIRLNNSSRYCALMWAVARCGCVLFPIKTSLTKLEMRKATAGIPLKVVVIDDSRHAVPRFDSIMARDLSVPLEPCH
jgi:acyl-CoA synthetase (AMP-forming)/AMP-acid ligase II